ncbi:MAG: hypothetical protein ACFFES_06910 [Candidatus Thorarchaeota archaeon]
MSKPMMFNGRLNKNESHIWLDLLQETNSRKVNDPSLALQFLKMPESISFVSSVADNIIGGTTIYRDRTRLSMVLISVAIKEAYREAATYQIIKASLPFFKTVAIRDVDILISNDEIEDPIGFPLSFEVDAWTRNLLERAGFEEVTKISQYSFDFRQGNYHPLMWDNEPKEEKAKELIWDTSKLLDLTNSLVWVARDFALAQKSFVTYTVNDKVSAVAGFWSTSNSLVVSPLMADPKVVDWSQVAEAIAAEGTKIGVNRVQLPLLGSGQAGLIEECEKISTKSSRRELSLMRKSL